MKILSCNLSKFEIGSYICAFIKNKKIIMAENTQEKESTGLYWIITIVSTLVTIALLIFANEWFWVGLPFALTGLVKATRGI